MNALTETEKLAVVGTSNEATKQDYRRYQFGGSFGGPIVQDKAHFFVALERTQQDTTQSVNTQGLFPSLDGVYADAVPREPLHRQGDGERQPAAVPDGALRPQQQLAALRCRARAPHPTTGATAPTCSTRSTSTTTGCSAASKLNEFIFQYADFRQQHRGALDQPAADVPQRRVDSAPTPTCRRRPSSTNASSATTSQLAQDRLGRPRS